ncbi:MAG: cytochrome c, partial [Nitrospira sp.]|nr:cytochrome c [Nitrospira sp.]
GAEMNRIAAASAGLAMLLGLAAVTEAQHEHGHPMIKEGTPTGSRQNERVALELSEQASAGMKLTMREHLEAIRDIVAALGRQDFEQAAKVAHDELGFPKHHQAMQREGGATFPPKYHELAMAHHQAAEDLAKVIPLKDLKTILPQLERTIGACVSCHQAFRL